MAKPTTMNKRNAMIIANMLSEYPISDTKDLDLEVFFLSMDKMFLEYEVERLKTLLDEYKNLVKEYQ